MLAIARSSRRSVYWYWLQIGSDDRLPVVSHHKVGAVKDIVQEEFRAMAGYWIIHGTIRDQSAFEEYARLWKPIAERYDAKFLVPGKAP